MSNNSAAQNNLEQLIQQMDQILSGGKEYCERYRHYVILGSETRTDVRASINKVIEASSDSIIRPSQDAAVLAKTVGPAIAFGIREPGPFLTELGKSLTRLIEVLEPRLSAVRRVSALASAEESYASFKRGQLSPLEIVADEAMNEELRALGQKPPALEDRYYGDVLRAQDALTRHPSPPLPTIDHVRSVEALLDEIEERTLTLKSVPVAPDEQEQEREQNITPQEASRIWETDASFWKENVGEGRPIPVRDTDLDGVELFSFLDAERFAKKHDPPIQRRDRSSR